MTDRRRFGRRSLLWGLGSAATLSFLGQSASADASSASSSSSASSARATEPWTVIALPDTQHYADSSERISFAHDQTSWVADNVDAENIAFVAHEGDVVNNAWESVQFERMDDVLGRLDGVVPYATVPGNHDWASWNDKSSSIDSYRRYFGPGRHEGRDYFGGSGPNDLCTYQYFDGGGREFLHLALEWEPRGSVDDPSTALGWADDVLAAHPNTPTIVTTHSFLWDEPGEEGRTTLVQEVDGRGNDGETVWQDLLEEHPQVFMTFNGHFHEDSGEVHRVAHNEAGYPVYQMLADYQHYPNGGDGWLRKVRFEPDGGANGLDRIAVETYSPSRDEYRTGAASEFHFDLEFDRRFDVAGTNAVSLQAGVDGYAGTVDTYVQAAAPDAANGTASTLNVDADDPGGSGEAVQALVRFEDVVGPGPDQIPPGVDVHAAALQCMTTGEGAGAAVHRMLRAWPESATWNDLDGGVDADGSDATATPAATSPPVNAKTEVAMDVRESVQAWVDGDANHGVALLPAGDDGWDFDAAEGETPPELVASYDPGPRYRIVNANSGKVLDVEGISTADGANLQQWEYAGGGNQQWYVTDRGNGYHTIQAVHSDGVVDVEGISAADGANVHQWPYVGGDNQQWLLEEQPEGYYRIVARHSGKVLEVEGGSTDDGANVQQWADAGADHQRWWLEAL